MMEAGEHVALFKLENKARGPAGKRVVVAGEQPYRARAEG
jgi:hypothetical protein